MESLLAHLRIPKTYVLTLVNPVSMEFVDSLHEMVIVFLPQDLDKLEIGVSLLGLMIGDPFKVKITSKSKKRKNLSTPGQSNPLGKGKSAEIKTPSPGVLIMHNSVDTISLW